ncbi:MAG: histidine kinase [Saprospiraceae bacterium]|nr:histidine kinase [Saprospiraceae bacterium]HNQ69506.1 histidine kinase [Bacteroidales bacterium]MCB0591898.1 histidine kinase [Saprospiraceae bacterium]MCO5282620.1 histidine kinase [Saprospiraceae bacterium]MCO6469322.1 histidine kinase [Saprospiraceae bacterium]
MSIRVVILIFCLIRCVTIVAQSQYSITIYRTENGLTSNNILFTFRTSDGFLWIATQYGVNRFDGNTFKNYIHDPNDSLTIGSTLISQILETRNSKVYFVHENGISQYHKNTNSFTNISALQLGLNKHEKIAQVREWKENTLLLITHERLIKYDPVKQNSNALVKFSNENQNYSSLACDTLNQTVYILNGSTLYKYSLPEKSLKEINTLKATAAPILLKVIANKLYFSTYNRGLGMWNIKTKKINYTPTERATPNYDVIRSMEDYDLSHVLVTSESAPYLFDLTNNKLTPILGEYEGILNEKVINHVRIADENIWVATTTGILCFQKKTFSLTKVITGKTNGSFANIQSFYGNNSILYSDYESGIIYEKNEVGNTIIIRGKPGQFLRYAFQDKKGYKWISTENRVYVKRPESQDWSNIPLDSTDYPRNFINDKDGALYLRIRNKGILKYNYDKARFEDFIIMDKKLLPLSGCNIINDRMIISSGSSGIFYLNVKNTKSLKKISNTKVDNFTIYNDSIIVISHGNNGISFYNFINQTSKVYTTSDGLLSENNFTVIKDGENNIWTYNAEGLNVINHREKAILSLTNDDLKLIQSIYIHNNKLYIASNKNMFSIDITKIKFSNKPSILYQDYASLNNKNITWPNQHIFKFYENNINLNFGVKTPLSSSKPSVEYRFSDENSWHDLFTNYQMSFQKLPPGKYELYIRLKNNADKRTWLISSWTITRPWYNTFWFYGLVAMVLIATVYMIYKYQLKSYKTKSELKQKITEYKTSALRAQMNPHFIFNSMAGIDNLVLEQKTELASDYLNKFAKLLRSVLESSKNEIIPFNEDWQAMKWYIDLELLRSNNQFQVNMVADQELNTGNYKVPPLVIQPYIENAIIHAMRKKKNGVLDISAQLHEDHILYTIKDNGEGMSMVHTKNHKSYGMEMNRERIRLFNNEEIKDEFIIESNNTGTVIKIKIAI